MKSNNIITSMLVGILVIGTTTANVDVNKFTYGNQITLMIEPDTTYSGFDLAELIPSNYEIESWNVIGYDMNKINFDTKNDVSFIGNTYYGNHWEFTDGITKPILLRYTINNEDIEGNFISVWTHPNGFGMMEDLL